MSSDPKNTGDQPKDPEGRPQNDPGLNPALKRRTDETHDTTRRTPAPAESASVQREEGRWWPYVWAAVVIVGILITIWLLL
jgi:hypothetical protein